MFRWCGVERLRAARGRRGEVHNIQHQLGAGASFGARRAGCLLMPGPRRALARVEWAGDPDAFEGEGVDPDLCGCDFAQGGFQN